LPRGASELRELLLLERPGAGALLCDPRLPWCALPAGSERRQWRVRTVGVLVPPLCGDGHGPGRGHRCRKAVPHDLSAGRGGGCLRADASLVPHRIAGSSLAQGGVAGALQRRPLRAAQKRREPALGAGLVPGSSGSSSCLGHLVVPFDP
ncbi:unnamed protein product, partial [Effrenium voratum]